MTVTMLPSAGEYAHHKGELFETDGTAYNVCGTECYLLRRDVAAYEDALREVLGIEGSDA